MPKENLPYTVDEWTDDGKRAERDKDDRDYWTGLANTWTRLAMIPERLTLR